MGFILLFGRQWAMDRDWWTVKTEASRLRCNFTAIVGRSIERNQARIYLQSGITASFGRLGAGLGLDAAVLGLQTGEGF